MTSFVALPLAILLAIALLGGRTLDRLSPPTATRLSAVLLATVLVAAVPTFWILALSGLAHAGIGSSLNAWSYHLLPDHPFVSGVIGGLAVVFATVGAVRMTLVLLAVRRMRSTHQCAFSIIETPEVFAYTLPGTDRHVRRGAARRRHVADRRQSRSRAQHVLGCGRRRPEHASGCHGVG